MSPRVSRTALNKNLGSLPSRGFRMNYRNSGERNIFNLEPVYGM